MGNKHSKKRGSRSKVGIPDVQQLDPTNCTAKEVLFKSLYFCDLLLIFGSCSVTAGCPEIVSGTKHIDNRVLVQNNCCCC